MAPRKLFPPSLKDSCLTQVLILVKNIARNYSQMAEIQEDKLTKDLKSVFEQVPLPLHDKFANLHLHGIKKVFGQEENRKDSYSGGTNGSGIDSFYQGESYFNCLMWVIGLLKIEKLHVYDWPEYVQVKLADFLDKMTAPADVSRQNLRSLDDGKLSNTCLQFCYLQSFAMRGKCTDKILSMLCADCAMLRFIDVELSDSVTDTCIQSVVSCENLREINLNATKVSPEGYFRLLNETKSSSLFRIGGLDASLNEILDRMELEKPHHAFKLAHLEFLKVDEKYLCLATKYFPFLTKVFFHYYRLSESHAVTQMNRAVPAPFSDLSVLSKLEYLKEVEFLFAFCFLEDVYKILSSYPSTTAVQFVDYRKSDLSILLSTTSKLCPSIEKLTINQSESYSPESENSPRTSLWTDSFQKLTELSWEYPNLEHVQHVLHHATNVQTIKFWADSDPALSDEFLDSVLNFNLLNELKELEINCPNNTVSCNMMKRVIMNCKQLTSFKIYSPALHQNPAELSDLIVRNNYDVDFVAHNESWDDDSDVGVGVVVAVEAEVRANFHDDDVDFVAHNESGDDDSDVGAVVVVAVQAEVHANFHDDDDE